jgi:hypothetical protein
VNFTEYLAAYSLGMLTPSDFPDAALAAMEEGYESESLYILAGIEKNENSFVKDEYWQKTLRELNISLPEEHEAQKTVIRYYAGQIVYHSADPYDTINMLYYKINDDYDDWDKFGLKEVVHLFWEFDYYTTTSDTELIIKQEMRELLRKWLDPHAVLITQEKIDVFRTYKGDIYARDKAMEGLYGNDQWFNEEEWLFVQNLLQDLKLIANGLASESYAEEVEDRLLKSCENDKVIQDIRDLAARS